MKIIKKLTAIGTANLGDDADLRVALFLARHPGWRPEDFGYPAGDYVMIDLIEQYDHYGAVAANARSAK